MVSQTASPLGPMLNLEVRPVYQSAPLWPLSMVCALWLHYVDSAVREQPVDSHMTLVTHQ